MSHKNKLPYVRYRILFGDDPVVGGGVPIGMITLRYMTDNKETVVFDVQTADQDVVEATKLSFPDAKIQSPAYENGGVVVTLFEIRAELNMLVQNPDGYIASVGRHLTERVMMGKKQHMPCRDFSLI